MQLCYSANSHSANHQSIINHTSGTSSLGTSSLLGNCGVNLPRCGGYHMRYLIRTNVLYRVREHKKKLQSKEPEDTSGEEGEVEVEETTKKVAPKSSVSVRPRKRKVTSQKDAICKLSTTFEKLQKSQEQRMQLLFEADRKREEAFLQYQEKQAELNRQHELRMMEMMVRFQQPMHPHQHAWMMPPESTGTYPTAFHGAETQQPHYTDLDNYNR